MLVGEEFFNGSVKKGRTGNRFLQIKYKTVGTKGSGQGVARVQELQELQTMR